MILINQIRKYTIHRLSTDFVLSPIEKIHLARAHKVAAWLNEGVTGLVSGGPRASLDDLVTLGWETAARILWIRDNCHSIMAANTVIFRRDTIRCGSCTSSASLLNGNYNCAYCGQAVPAGAELAIPGHGTASETGDRLVQLRVIQCHNINCRQALFYSISVQCSFCSHYHNTSSNVRITPKKGVKEMIEEMFGEEIRNYEVAA